MKKSLYTIFIFLCATCVCTQAQEKKGPDLQTVDDGFFDPTRKEKKVAEEYHFGMEYRIEAGFIQNDLRVPNDTARFGFRNGGRIGVTFNFLLPYHLGIETGLLYSLSYGAREEHYRSMDAESVQVEYIRHRVMEHALTIPIRANYTIPVWKKLNLTFYTGPQLQIGVAAQDNLLTHLSEGIKNWLEERNIHTAPYDQYKEGELSRVNIQYGLGAAIEWDRYRLQGGYDFGLNNLLRNPVVSSQRAWEWQWQVVFCYKLK